MVGREKEMMKRINRSYRTKTKRKIMEVGIKG